MAAAAVVIGAAVAWLAVLPPAFCEFYDTFTGRQISPDKYRALQAQRLVPYCAIEVQPCDENERRRLDNSCNNLHYPSRGATLTPYRRMLPPMFDASSNHRPSSSGAPLPNARRIRTSIMSDGRVESKTYTQLVPNSAVFITGDITSVHDTVNYVAVTTTCCSSGQSDPRCMPIRVPDDDVHLRYSNVRCLNLTKVITYQVLGCAPSTLPPERINTSPPMLEMSIIYGNDESTARKGLEGSGGRLKEEMVNGVIYPPNGGTKCFQNRPTSGETRCHNTPHPGTNSLLGINIMSLWYWRNHNRIARRLEAMNPCWNNERLFSEAREINIAMANQIWYYELMPTVIGFDYLLKSKAIFETSGHINDYDPYLEPRVSIEYVIGTRWFHSIQEGRLKTYDNKGRLTNQLNAVELTLRTGLLANNRTLQGLTQGTFRQPTGESDHIIDPDMGERVLGSLQAVSDVASADIMKSREAGLPPYNHYRKICGLPVLKDFDDLEGWMYQEQIDGLKLNYEDVDDIDLMAGIYAEKKMKGALVGPTLACIMTDQLVWWRRADRFWYENDQHPGSFTPEQLREIREMTLSRLICDNGDEVDQIQPFSFFVPRDDNKLVDCKMLQESNLDVWRDEQCQIDMNNKLYQQQQQKLNEEFQQKNAVNNKQQVNVQAIGFQQQLDGPFNQQIINNQNNGLIGINSNLQIANNNQNNIGTNGNQQIVNNQNNGLIGLNNNLQFGNNNNQINNAQNQNGRNTNQQVANNQNNGLIGINNNQQISNNLINQRLTNAIPSNNINWDQNVWDVENVIGEWNSGNTKYIGWGPGTLSKGSNMQGPGNQGAVSQVNWQNTMTPSWDRQNVPASTWQSNWPNGPNGGWPNGNWQNNQIINQNGAANSNQQIANNQNNGLVGLNNNLQIANNQNNGNQINGNQQLVNNQNNGLIGINVNDQIANVQNNLPGSNGNNGQNQNNLNQQLANNQNNGLIGVNVNDQIANVQNNLPGSNQNNGQNQNNLNQQLANNQNNGLIGVNVNDQIANVQNNLPGSNQNNGQNQNNLNQQLANNQNNGLIGVNVNDQIANVQNNLPGSNGNNGQNQNNLNQQLANNQNNGLIGVNVNDQIANVQNNLPGSNGNNGQNQNNLNQQLTNNQNNGLIGVNVNDQIANVQNNLPGSNGNNGQNQNNLNQQLANNQNNGVVGINVNDQISNIQNNANV